MNKKRFDLTKKLYICLIFTLAASYASSQTVTKTGTYKCGLQPKQVLFSPDSKYIIMPLLGDKGFDIFSVETKTIRRIEAPSAKECGYAEGLFIPEKNSFFISQMTTGKIYEYTYPGFEYKREISTKATWSKFIAYCPEKNILAVSNWVSNNISIIDYDTEKVLLFINTKASPRGIFFVNGGKEIISLAFDGHAIEKFETDTGKLIKSIPVETSAMRHIVCDNAKKYAYVSDMYHRCVYKVNLESFSIESKARVFNNPNTIDLYKDKYLFVSCRGPNNPEDYTKRSPVNGKIYIIKTDDMSYVSEIDGGNQPTGLDVSPDNKYLCFSNFQDENIELYEIK